MEIDMEQGRFLVKTARDAITEHLSHRSRISPPEETPDQLREKAGVFVTIKSHPGDELKGCIGHPYPESPLIEALIDSAISACSNDPRFPPVKESEIDGIILEVTVLTPPEEMKVARPSEYPKEIEIGRHGLIVKKGWYQGLLLPQVAVEQGWDEEEFLSHTCHKAGLPPTAWIDEETKVQRFEGFVFGEEEPGGKVLRMD